MRMLEFEPVAVPPDEFDLLALLALPEPAAVAASTAATSRIRAMPAKSRAGVGMRGRFGFTTRRSYGLAAAAARANLSRRFCRNSSRNASLPCQGATNSCALVLVNGST
jgi:hypothetical protein